MNLRVSILIVGATAVALLLGFAGVVVVGKVAQALRSAATSETARQEFVAKWRPPRELTMARLLPDRVGDSSVTSRVEIAQWTNVGVDLAAVRGVYANPAGLTVEVVAARTRPESEAADRETVVASLKARLDRQSGTKTVITLGDRWQASASEPPERLDLWALPGWLILFRSDREIPLPFTKGYLEAIAEPQTRL
ncbi:MAG: hypothetical protein AB7O66_01215 [Limisphaerales bacterium]